MDRLKFGLQLWIKLNVRLEAPNALDMEFTYLRLMPVSCSTRKSHAPYLTHSENAKNREFFGIKHAVAHLLSKIYSLCVPFQI
ncbi:hypothetical protein [Campylobacter gracilis]|uniref:Uncharacterized protein n=1 Tax=Campylobacter gracilis RM3268 TaxID=553220 RepID=C8PEU2_9BACT|nr:hypothetical protein [Campylobacter gracilis]EEV18570.1 hypothetical protein CAMGR0001_2581 [Campylobacter gracilis RM3268]UEB45931.1 hypothetical protein LK410_02210 [Campylobacter gracilis]